MLTETDSKQQDGKSKTIVISYEGCSYNCEEILKLIGFGRVQWVVLITTGLLIMMAMNEVMGMGFVAIAAKCDFQLDSIDKGIMTGISYLGNVCSSHLWGFLSDTIGRKPVIIYSTIIGNVISLMSMFVPNFWIFIALRFLVGFSLSGATSVCYAYLGEFMTNDHRRTSLTFASSFGGVSCIYVPFVSWLVLWKDWSIPMVADFVFHPWRLLLFCYLMPGLLAAFAVFILPESPKLLLSLGKHQQAYKAMDWICRSNLNGRSLADLNVQKLKPSTGNNNEDCEMYLVPNKSCSGMLQKVCQDICSLFRRPHVYNFLICCTVMCSAFMSAMGLGAWFPEIQNRLYFGEEGEESVCQIIKTSFEAESYNASETVCDNTVSDNSYIDFSIYGAMCTVGYIILGLIINVIDRKTILISFLVVSGLSGIALLWILEPIGIALMFSLFLVLSELSQSIVSGVVVDLIPTRLCGQAVCICLMLARLSSVIATNMIGFLLDSQCIVTFLIFSGFSLLCGFISFFLPI